MKRVFLLSLLLTAVFISEARPVIMPWNEGVTVFKKVLAPYKVTVTATYCGVSPQYPGDPGRLQCDVTTDAPTSIDFYVHFVVPLGSFIFGRYQWINMNLNPVIYHGTTTGYAYYNLQSGESANTDAYTWDGPYGM